MEVNQTRKPEINDWLDVYLLNPAETTYVTIAFEYLNNYCTTILALVLKQISQVILQDKKFVIHWYYEKDDEDILDRGGNILLSLFIYLLDLSRLMILITVSAINYIAICYLPTYTDCPDY